MKKLIDKFRINYSKLFVFSAIGGFLLYSPIAYQALWNPDSLNRTIYINDIIWVQQARWGCQLWETFMRSGFIFPVLTLLFSIIFLAAIVVLTVDIFDIKNSVDKVLVSLCILTSIHQLSTMTYAYCGDEFTLAYFLAVCAAFFLSKMWDEKSRLWINAVGAVVCTVMSLAIYQAYIAIMVIVVGTKFVIELYSKRTALECVKRVVLQITTMGVALIGYVVSVKISLVVYNTELSSYRNMSKGIMPDISVILSGVKNAYTHFYNYFFTDNLYNNSFRGRTAINIIVAIGILVLLTYLAVRNREKMNIAKYSMLVLSIILFPLGFNVVHLMTDTGVSFMMLPAIPYLYIIFIILIEYACTGKTYDNIIKMLRVPIILAVYTSILVINMATEELRININKATSIANNMDVSIKAHEDYTQDTCVLVVGNYNKGNYPEIYDYVFSPVLSGTVHDFGQFWMGEDLGLSTARGWAALFRQYCGSKYNVCSQEEYDAIVITEEFNNMGMYPEGDSIKMINNVLVIKLSEELY